MVAQRRFTGRPASLSSVDSVTFDLVPPDSADGLAALRAYFADILGRFRGRPASDAEVDELLAEDPLDGLAPPAGVFVLATVNGRVAGCAGLRLQDGGFAEAKRVYVYPHARGRGLARAVMAHLEELATAHGRTALRLDTHSDLTEARSLYAALGYRETAAFNDNPYAHHWFVKDLRSRG